MSFGDVILSETTKSARRDDSGDDDEWARTMELLKEGNSAG